MSRIEKDSLGIKEIPSDALYGIHSSRARENFPAVIPFPAEWYKAVLITSLSGLGNLELNAYLSSIGCALIESLKLLISCNVTLLHNLFEGLEINEAAGYIAVLFSPSVTTALVPYIGYNKAAEIAVIMKDKKTDVYEANSITKSIDPAMLETILQPANLLKLGFSIDDL